MISSSTSLTARQYRIFRVILFLSSITQISLAFNPTRQPFGLFRSRQSVPVPPLVCQARTAAFKVPFRVVNLKEGVDVDVEVEEESTQAQEADTDDEEDEESKTYQINLQLAQLARKCARRGRQSRMMAMTAYDLLQNMTHPDTVAYNSVLNAFAKSSPTKLPNTTGPWVTAAERAQDLLEEMVQRHDEQAAASQDWYVRNAQGQLTDEELAQGPPRVMVKPNVRSFSTVMDAWSRTGNVQATLDVLHSLEDRYEQSGQDIALQPNIFSYNTVLAAYSKSKNGGAAQDAQEFLETLMPVRPDVISYNAVLHAWARSGSPNAGEHAETILRGMPGVRPNARSYTTVMDAWSRSRQHSPNDPSPAERAHSLLEELKTLYERTGEELLKPNCVSYSTVIHAYALSKEPQKAQRAFELLQEMNAKGQDDPQVLPNTVTYNSVLNACATSSPLSSYSKKTEVSTKDDDTNDDNTTKDSSGEVCLQNIVQTLYHQLTQNDIGDSKSIPNNRRQLQPDHFTFGTVLKACANNIFWDDPTFGMYVFEEACRRGQVSVGVLVQLRQAVPQHVFQEFLPDRAYDSHTRQFSMSHIPDKWKRNVRERGSK